VVNLARKVSEIKLIVGENTGYWLSHAAAEQVMDLLEKVYHAGIAAAVDNEIREKVREQLANDPHCYD
jgi:hypothetical protein